MDKTKITQIQSEVAAKTQGIINDITQTVKEQSRGVALGLGVGVLLAGPLPGGIVVAAIGAGIIAGSLFVKR